MNSSHLEDPIAAEIESTMLIKKICCGGVIRFKTLGFARGARPTPMTLAG